MKLNEETIVTIVEAIAALADTEAFMDYIDKILRDKTAYLFI